jgi:hypothetical protein
MEKSRKVEQIIIDKDLPLAFKALKQRDNNLVCHSFLCHLTTRSFIDLDVCNVPHHNAKFGGLYLEKWMYFIVYTFCMV